MKENIRLDTEDCVVSLASIIYGQNRVTHRCLQLWIEHCKCGRVGS